VTGTRGKSTVTRLIASALREAGYPVLAKTTGSRPVLIFPDRSETEIKRRGPATILEQVKILRRGAKLGVRALVAELMSIKPECAFIESRRILRPQILVITNVRLDHRDEMGGTKREIAASLASAIPPGATVFVPEAESYPEFESAAARAKATLIKVPAGSGRERLSRGSSGLFSPFAEHVDLALAVAAHLGIPGETARRGIAEAHPDFGGLKAWEALLGSPPVPWLMVSAFAANEPESTGIILERIREGPAGLGRPLIGLIALRSDRGDRTRQWIEALDSGFFSGFEKLYLAGAHLQTGEIRKRRKKLRSLETLPGRSPGSIMERLAAGHRSGAVLIGMGNMVGLGAALIEHWERIGRPHAL
jgi:poly-gamma-glutamate synthase PgsB/CapB